MFFFFGDVLCVLIMVIMIDAFRLHKIEREGTKSTPAVSIMLIRVNTDLLLRKKKKRQLVCLCVVFSVYLLLC